MNLRQLPARLRIAVRRHLLDVLDERGLVEGWRLEWSPEQALGVLAAVPAWRLLDAARLELGSRLLVIGDGWLRGSVERLARLRGALPADSGPAPDAVILAGVDAAKLLGALPRVAHGGVLAVMLDAAPFDIDVYPDLHRRGLRLTLLHPCALPADWPRVRRGLSHFLARGLLAG